MINTIACGEINFNGKTLHIGLDMPKIQIIIGHVPKNTMMSTISDRQDQ